MKKLLVLFTLFFSTTSILGMDVAQQNSTPTTPKISVATQTDEIYKTPPGSNPTTPTIQRKNFAAASTNNPGKNSAEKGQSSEGNSPPNVPKKNTLSRSNSFIIATFNLDAKPVTKIADIRKELMALSLEPTATNSKKGEPPSYDLKKLIQALLADEVIKQFLQTNLYGIDLQKTAPVSLNLTENKTTASSQKNAYRFKKRFKKTRPFYDPYNLLFKYKGLYRQAQKNLDDQRQTNANLNTQITDLNSKLKEREANNSALNQQISALNTQLQEEKKRAENLAHQIQIIQNVHSLSWYPNEKFSFENTRSKEKISQQEDRLSEMQKQKDEETKKLRKSLFWTRFACVGLGLSGLFFGALTTDMAWRAKNVLAWAHRVEGLPA